MKLWRKVSVRFIRLPHKSDANANATFKTVISRVLWLFPTFHSNPRSEERSIIKSCKGTLLKTNFWEVFLGYSYFEGSGLSFIKAEWIGVTSSGPGVWLRWTVRIWRLLFRVNWLVFKRVTLEQLNLRKTIISCYAVRCYWNSDETRSKKISKVRTVVHSKRKRKSLWSRNS